MIKQLANMETGGGFCPECGPVFFDEDGQCVNCGATANGKAINELVREAAKILAELETLKPQPPREGIYPWAIPLEVTARHADFWFKGGQEKERRDEVIICVAQAVNSWKNACYSYAERVFNLERQLAEAKRVSKLGNLSEVQGVLEEEN